ncbi:MAG: efflux RND transporter periplasmic adaptor subunit [Bacteroidaceae bacterium]|nr:efflux RND transporter periplasmic adaptor subunit [Bacteroidaceae bacterium]
MDRIIEKKKGLRKKHIPYVLLGLFVLVLLIWAIFGNHASTMKVDAEQLTISPVTKGEFKDYVRLSGTVVPIQVVQISPEEGGIVMEKVAEEGQSVKKGDVIVRLSNSNLDLQILNAEAELAEKQNLLRNTQVAMQQDKLNNETEAASLSMDVARKKRNYEQNQRLYSEKLISKETYLQAKEDYELAQKKQQLVSDRLAKDAQYRSLQMDQMEDNLANMRRNVVLVHERKNKLAVRSNIDGELGLLDVELGQNISAGQKIGQINDLSDFKIEAQIDEHYIDRVKVGLRATAPLRMQQGGETELSLVVRKVYPEVREGKFRVDFILPKDSLGKRGWEGVRVGQTFYLNLELGQPQQAILVPRGTFFQTTGGNWIFVLDKSRQKAYRRTIKIGRQNPQYYEVEEGLEAGEQVVTSGYEAFKDNEVLEIK